MRLSLSGRGSLVRYGLLLSLLLFLLAHGLACATPTAITVTADSEVACEAGASVAIVGGPSLSDLATRAPAATSSECQPEGSEVGMGSVVIVPAGARNESVAFAVMTRPDGTSPAHCLETAEAPHCIVAFRELRFIPETELAVRVDLRIACLGVQCGSGQTCVEGSCVSDVVSPGTCPASGCTEGNLIPDGGVPPPPDARAPDAAEAAVDAAVDTAESAVDAFPEAAPADVAADVVADALPPPPVTYPIDVTVTGLTPGAVLDLQDTATDTLDTLRLTSNGTGAFATQLPSGATYSVTVSGQPAGETCSVSAGTGTVAAAGVDISVVCVGLFTVGGTVSALAPGDTVALQDNGGDMLFVGSNGSFQFSTPIPGGSPYAVTVLANPASPLAQACTIAMGTGTITSDVANVAVTCVTSSFTIGGTLVGLPSGGVVTLEDASGGTALTANGPFTIGPVASGTAYDVTIAMQPTGATCTVTDGSGQVGASNVTSVLVNCGLDYAVGGTMSGLSDSESVVLQNEGGENLTLTANGSFVFPALVAPGSSYDITVYGSPATPIAETCMVSMGSGVVGTANVTSPTVTCAPTQFTVGVTVTGLSGSGNEVSLSAGIGSLLTATTNGFFQFPGTFPSRTSYAIIVTAQPTTPPETCTVAMGSGTISNANVEAFVTCAPVYTIGGTVSGLPTGGAMAAEVTLADNGGNNVQAGNGAFVFAGTEPSGYAYDITVVGVSVGQVCTVMNGSGTVTSANVTSPTVVCTSIDGGTDAGHEGG